MHPLVILVALVLCLAVVLVAVEGGLVAWALKGGPDYLDEPDDAYPEGHDMQQGFVDTIDRATAELNRSWPRDTGTKP